MIKHIYAFYDKKVGAYETPIYQSLDIEDFKTLVFRDVVCSTNEVKERMLDKELYYLGTFNDENAEYKVDKPQFVVAISNLLGIAVKEENHGERVPN